MSKQQRQVLISRAPVTMWGAELRPGETFTTTPEAAAELIGSGEAEIYADQDKPDVSHHRGEGPRVPRTTANHPAVGSREVSR